MDLLVVGMSHKTAPLEIRERLSFRAAHMCEANRRLKESASLEENLILSTCNRVEIYALGPKRQNHLNGIENFLSYFHRFDISGCRHRLYVHKDKEAVTHLFKVACGLDSMVLGEMEIARQIKKAYQDARDSRTTGKVLNRLFEKAFKTVKEIRSKTLISHGASSISALAVNLAKEKLRGLSDKKALIVGAGKVGERLVSYLKNESIGSILVTNRTPEKARDITLKFGADTVAFEDFKSKLAEIDILITCAQAPGYLISRDEAQSLMLKRGDRQFFIIDLAVPRSVEAQVRQLGQVYLYDIEDLQKIACENQELNQEELESCFGIIRGSSDKFINWMRQEGLGRQ